MNPCLILTKNNLVLTQRCIESVRAQDIPVSIHVWDNQSTDGTLEWLKNQDDIEDHSNGTDLGVSAAWNFVLEELFSATLTDTGENYAEHALVINNDVVLPKSFYSELLSYDVPFVTGVATNNMTEVLEPHDRMPLSSHPDFSAFLIRRECWEAVGPFDERMVLYSSDQDFHIRAHFAGVHLWKANNPYYHINSQTLHRSTPEEKANIHAQANRDRQVLREKWGVPAGGPLYEALFTPETFGSQRVAL